MKKFFGYLVAFLASYGLVSIIATIGYTVYKLPILLIPLGVLWIVLWMTYHVYVFLEETIIIEGDEPR